MNEELPGIPLSESEKDKLMCLIEAMANSNCNSQSILDEFHRLLMKLQMKYGELAYLTSLKADFLIAGSPFEQIQLYKRSVELAKDPLDIAALIQSAGSIAEIYIVELSDYDNGLEWLQLYKEYINQYGDKYIVVNPLELEPKLKRLTLHAISKNT